MDRLKRPLESPFSGRYEVIQRGEKVFKIKYASGKAENVSIHRLKPVIESWENVIKRVKDLHKAAKLVINDDDDKINDKESLEDNAETEADTNALDHDLSNHEKFAHKIPYSSRYGRRIKFAEQNHEILIPKYGGWFTTASQESHRT